MPNFNKCQDCGHDALNHGPIFGCSDCIEARKWWNPFTWYVSVCSVFTPTYTKAELEERAKTQVFLLGRSEIARIKNEQWKQATQSYNNDTMIGYPD